MSSHKNAEMSNYDNPATKPRNDAQNIKGVEWIWDEEWNEVTRDKVTVSNDDGQ